MLPCWAAVAARSSAPGRRGGSGQLSGSARLGYTALDPLARRRAELLPPRRADAIVSPPCPISGRALRPNINLDDHDVQYFHGTVAELSRCHSDKRHKQTRPAERAARGGSRPVICVPLGRRGWLTGPASGGRASSGISPLVATGQDATRPLYNQTLTDAGCQPALTPFYLHF